MGHPTPPSWRTNWRAPTKIAVRWVALPWPILPVPTVLLALCRVVEKKSQTQVSTVDANHDIGIHPFVSACGESRVHRRSHLPPDPLDDLWHPAGGIAVAIEGAAPNPEGDVQRTWRQDGCRKESTNPRGDRDPAESRCRPVFASFPERRELAARSPGLPRAGCPRLWTRRPSKAEVVSQAGQLFVTERKDMAIRPDRPGRGQAEGFRRLEIGTEAVDAYAAVGLRGSKMDQLRDQFGQV